MTKNKQAVIFIRARHIGTDDQTAIETQITAQRAECQKAANKLNVCIVREYVERSGTDRLDRRPIVRQMLAELGQARDADYVITYGGDRLARRGIDFVEIDDVISAAGAELVFANEVLDQSCDQYPKTICRDVRRVFAVLADQK